MKKLFISVIALSLLSAFDVQAIDKYKHEQISGHKKASQSMVDVSASCMTLMDVAALLTIAPSVYITVVSQMARLFPRWPYFSMGASFATGVIAASACSECGKLLFYPLLGEQWNAAKAVNKKLQSEILGYAIIAAFIGFIISR